MSKEQLQGCECKWWKQLVQLKQTLTEIKEIAEGKNREFIDNDAVVLEILQKISEVGDG